MHHPQDEPKGSLREPRMRVWEFTRCQQNAALIYYSFPGCGSLKVFSEYHNEKRPVRLKFDRKARMYCLAGENGHFQIIVSQPPSLFFFVQPNDPRMLCDRFMGAFRTHFPTRFVTAEFILP